jgi:hypothetical protein
VTCTIASPIETLNEFLPSTVYKDPKFPSKSKHIEGWYHYIRDVINRLKSIHLVYLPSNSMVADPLTKLLVRNYFPSILETWTSGY